MEIAGILILFLLVGGLAISVDGGDDPEVDPPESL